MKQFATRFLTYRYSILLLAVFSVFITTLQAIYSTESSSTGAIVYTDYNNYVIFKQSFYHLIDLKDLYIAYPNEYWDLYKYTPTFSLFFGVFAIFPDAWGVGLWSLLNVVVLVLAVQFLPRLSTLQKNGILLIAFIELITSIQNEQSNALLVGLLVLAFGLLERKYYFWAAFCIVFSVYIKLFGIVAIILFLFYPKKVKLAIYMLFWSLFLFALPLLVVGWEHYTFLWDSFFKMLSQDHAESYGYSVMGILSSWFNMAIDKKVIVFIGAVILAWPFLKRKAYQAFTFRVWALASVLIWVVIFNHKAESPTFVIAMIGVGIWFVTQPKNAGNISLLVFALLLTSLSTTDVFPVYVREHFIKPFALMALPSLIIWMLLTYRMVTFQPKPKA